MHSDSSELQRLSQNWLAITWQLGDRERQLRRSLVSLEETLGDVLQRALMEACVMGFLNKKIAFTEPEEFASQWQVFVYRDGEEVQLPLNKRVEILALSSGERLIFRPQSVSADMEESSLDASPSYTGLPQSFIKAPPKSNNALITYALMFAMLVLVGLVVLLLFQ